MEDDALTACGAGNQTAGLNVAQRLAISPDGANVYVAAAGDSSLVTFSRELPPVCRPRAVSGAAGAQQAVPLDCADPNGDAFELVLSSPPANGTLAAINQATDSVVYTPNPGFAGIDVFSYRAQSDFKDSNVVTATILVGQAGPAGPLGRRARRARSDRRGPSDLKARPARRRPLGCWSRCSATIATRCARARSCDCASRRARPPARRPSCAAAPVRSRASNVRSRPARWSLFSPQRPARG